MDTAKNLLLIGVLCSVFAAALLSGCATKGDPIMAAEQADKEAGIAAPGIAETKAIAEEGFIYGLPIVMNYSTMYEYARIYVTPKPGFI